LSCSFLAEVHSGDTLYPALTITGLEPEGDNGIVVTASTIHNQRGEMVLSGQHKYLLRRQQVVSHRSGPSPEDADHGPSDPSRKAERDAP
jgi:hypothetical protein